MSKKVSDSLAAGLLILMLLLAGGAGLHESATVDEIAHVGAGLSYLQRFDLRLNPEHPPLAKVLAALPLVLQGVHADYTGTAWTTSGNFFAAYSAQWVFGDAVLGRWNNWKTTLMWARAPMLVLTLVLGWLVYRYGSALGGSWGGLLCLSMYVTTPAFLVFGLLVITDLPVVLFSLLALWRLGAIWTTPSHRNALLFGSAFGAALLSKFTGLLIVPVILVLLLQSRFWPSSDQPADEGERKNWRRARFLSVLRGVLWAALVVYVSYLVLSWNQPDDALDRIGSGPWASLVRRPLMPLWLYFRGILLMLFMGSRPTYLFGHNYEHGVPYYFPVVFALKSTLGFLLLLVMAALVRFLSRRERPSVIPEAYRAHWRVLKLGLWVFLVVCILSRLDISIRHFMVPIVLLILMLAPLPCMIEELPRARLLQAVTIVLVVSCFVPILRAYPYYFPFVNSLGWGRPAYFLINDSNVTWNEGLEDVERFVRQEKLSSIELDWASFSDPKLVVPEAQMWDCQAPTAEDAGQWVAVTSVSILENRNCGYLQSYPHRELAGGAFYVFKLPKPIPAPGSPGGPPVLAARRILWGLPMEMRSWMVDMERHPEELPMKLRLMMETYQQQSREQAKKKTPG